MFADYTAGHKINAIDKAYWKFRPEDLKKDYLDAFPYLSLDQAKVRDVETKEYKEQLKQTKEKDKIMSDLVNEIAEMKKQNQARDKFLDKIMSNPQVIEELEELDKLDK